MTNLRELRAEQADLQGTTRKNLKVVVPVLPEPVREPPQDFQALLDEFNRSTHEHLFVYFNPVAVAKLGSTVNLDGTYTVLGKEGRWELYRPVPETLSVKQFERIQPVIIQGIGTATKLWTIEGEPFRTVAVKSKDSDLTLRPNGYTTMRIGEYREPDQREIKTLRWCDMMRTPEGEASVMEEIFGRYNERQSEAAEREMDDLVDAAVEYHWHRPNPIVPVGGGAKHQKADWRAALR